MTFKEWFEALSPADQLKLKASDCKDLACEAFGSGWTGGLFSLTDDRYLEVLGDLSKVMKDKLKEKKAKVTE